MFDHVFCCTLMIFHEHSSSHQITHLACCIRLKIGQMMILLLQVIDTFLQTAWCARCYDMMLRHMIFILSKQNAKMFSKMSRTLWNILHQKLLHLYRIKRQIYFLIYQIHLCAFWNQERIPKRIIDQGQIRLIGI